MSNVGLAPIKEKNLSNFSIYTKMAKLGEAIKKHPQGVTGGTPECQTLCPLKESFAKGVYIREIFMPQGTLLVTKIHRFKSPYFIMKGDCSVLAEDGTFEHVIAPCSGITTPGTQRVIYIHEDTTWITVHDNPTEERDTKKLEDRIIMRFEEVKKITEGI